MGREYPCLWDTASLVGLKQLEKRWPALWRDCLWQYARQPYPVTSVTVVQDLLGTRFDRRCLPERTTSVSTLSAPRSYAGRLRRLLPPRLSIFQLAPQQFDHLERDFVSRGEAPAAASRLIVHLRTLVNEARRQHPGLTALPDRRRRASSSLGEVHIRPSALAAIAQDSNLRVRAALGLLLLRGGTRRALVRIECSHLIGDGSAVLLSGTTWPVPQFVAQDLSQLRDAALGGRWLFPGSTSDGRLSERTVSRWLIDAGSAHLRSPLQIADVGRLGQRLQDDRRGGELRRDVLALRSWEEFGRLVVPGPVPRRAPPVSVATELRGVRSKLEAVERSQNAERARAAEFEQRVRAAFDEVAKRLRVGRKNRVKLGKAVAAAKGTAISRGQVLDRLAAQVTDLQERQDTPSGVAEHEPPRTNAPALEVHTARERPAPEPTQSPGPPPPVPSRRGGADFLGALLGLAGAAPIIADLMDCDPEDLEAALYTWAEGWPTVRAPAPSASPGGVSAWEPDQGLVPESYPPNEEYEYSYDEHSPAVVQPGSPYGDDYDPYGEYPPPSVERSGPDRDVHPWGEYYPPEFDPTHNG